MQSFLRFRVTFGNLADLKKMKWLIKKLQLPWKHYRINVILIFDLMLPEVFLTNFFKYFFYLKVTFGDQ